MVNHQSVINNNRDLILNSGSLIVKNYGNKKPQNVSFLSWLMQRKIDKSSVKVYIIFGLSNIIYEFVNNYTNLF